MTKRQSAILAALLIAAAAALPLSACGLLAARKTKAQHLRDPGGAFWIESKYLPFGTQALSDHAGQGSLYRLHEADLDVSELHTEPCGRPPASMADLLRQYAARRLAIDHSEPGGRPLSIPGAADAAVLHGTGAGLESGEARTFATAGCTARGRLFVFYREEKRLESSRRMARQSDEVTSNLAAFVRRFHWTRSE